MTTEKISEEELNTFKALQTERDRISKQLEVVSLQKDKIDLQMENYAYKLHDKYDLKPGRDTINGDNGEITRAVPEVVQAEAFQEVKA